MAGHHRKPRIGLAAAGMLAATVPLLFAQGCPGPNQIIPISDSGSPTSFLGDDTTGTGNALPTFRFLTPDRDISAEVGDLVNITWQDDDPDSNALITLLVDPDLTYGNGNETVILPVIFEDDDITGDSFVLDTSSLPKANYRIIARVNDAVNPELIVVAKGQLNLFGRGFLPGNRSPSILVSEPALNVGVLQGDTVNLAYCGSDPDDGEAGDLPDIILLLDLDDDPTNDLDLGGDFAEAETRLATICRAGFFPQPIDGAIILGCFKDTDCPDPTAAASLLLTIDVGQIPPRASGEPYRVRATMWDHTNPAVHAYARGSISITSLASGSIDLAQVGRTISGARFQGFDAGGRAGYAGLGLGDLDGDDADEFIVVNRWGRAFEAGNVGSAQLVFGKPGEKFGGEVSLNSISTLVRGSVFTMPGATVTEGIVSVARVGDVTGDQMPELLFGTPYVEKFWDNHDDDPCDCSCPDGITCYNDGRRIPDLLPNPISADCPGFFQQIRDRDHREFVCSNDLDLSRETPIDGGYAILVGSQNNLDGSVFSLRNMGESSSGARFRGPWWPRSELDYTQTRWPYAIIPDNLFGQTVRSMPPMTDSSASTPPDFGSTLLISSPNAARGRGMVIYIPGRDFTTYTADNSNTLPNTNSLPFYEAVDCRCPPARRRIVYPPHNVLTGAAIGDEFGYASAAGDYNLDGSRDILCGAPGADRNGVIDSGVVYVIFGRPDFPSIDLGTINPPRMEIHGTVALGRFGEMQTLVGDINQDGLPDIGFSSQSAAGASGAGEAGFIGIIFGGRPLTGENIFIVDQVGTLQLPGVKLHGTQPGGHAGATINNAGDFNGDSTDDLLIVAPGETRTVNGQIRRGVTYLLFGGTHLNNGEFNLDQVGTPELPGLVFASPYIQGTADEAPTDWAGAAGDVDNDGFGDILIGVSRADYVNPLEPSQRRPDAGEAYLIYGNNTGTNTLGG